MLFFKDKIQDLLTCVFILILITLTRLFCIYHSETNTVVDANEVQIVDVNELEENAR